MSTCNNSTSATHCPCDDHVHPAPLVIDAGQTDLARQIAAFPAFRRAMILAATAYEPLQDWAATKDQDLGVMLIEMWAYVCDVLAFYDGVIAHESYLRTAKLRPSVRKLVDLLGYVPRPATAATVQLAALAHGRQSVTLPKGLAFRSIAFEGEPPQVFEMDASAVIHPFTNQWELKGNRSSGLRVTHPSKLTVLPILDIPDGTMVLVRYTDLILPQNPFSEIFEFGFASVDHLTRVVGKSKFKGDDGVFYTELSFAENLNLLAGTNLDLISVLKFKETARLWTQGTPPYLDLAHGSIEFYLDKVYDNLKTHTTAVVELATKRFVVYIEWVKTSRLVPNGSDSVVINGNTFQMPGIKVEVSHFRVKNADLTGAFMTLVDMDAVRVYFGPQNAAKVTYPGNTTLAPTTQLPFKTKVEQPNAHLNPTRFLLEDKNHVGVALQGALDKEDGLLSAPNVQGWTQPLYFPVKAFGNVVQASRGESVFNEILGSGNASLGQQAFQLKKKPLTYVLSPAAGNAQGVASTLVVHVDGMRWTEVPNFYLSGPDDAVFIVRQTDIQDSIVTFGDGIRGRRLPTGHSNVVAHYRFGAGAATPPAGGIHQIGKPVAGLQAIVNPVAASPGADAEDQDHMRSNAPASILVMGRAVSIQDMQAVAAAVPGVRVAQAAWRWSDTAHCPTVHVWYIGADGLQEAIQARLQSISDPNTLFTVEKAKPNTQVLTVDLAQDPRYEPVALKEAIAAALFAPKTGFLTPENLGIGQHLFRSQLWAAILAVPGLANVRYICLATAPGAPIKAFGNYALAQKAGQYWDFETYPSSITFNQDLY
jgi:hypothetical protein